MFRENVLVKEDIIDRISETMIPVALNYEKVLDRKSREAKFLLPLMTQGNHDKQGLWIFSPERETLGYFTGFGDMHGKAKRLIDHALKNFGPVEKRKVNPGQPDAQRGMGFKRDGSVLLAQYVRRQDQDKIKSPVISSVSLSSKEFRSFAPEKAKAGAEWKVPNAVAKKLCRLASPMCYQHAPQPDWVKEVTLHVKVRSLENGVAKLGYVGTMESERIWRNGKVLSKQVLKIEGEGIFDARTKQMRSLLVVGSGQFRWPEEAPEVTVPFHSLLEWDANRMKSASVN